MRCSNDTCENGGICDFPFRKCSCKPGWVGDNCQTECPPGLFGTDCIKKCNCYSGYFCNAQYGCIKNPCHDMPFYETAFFLVSAVISAVLVTAIIFIVILILKKRRQSVLHLRDPEPQNQVQELCTIQNCVPSQENNYEETTNRENDTQNSKESLNHNLYEEPSLVKQLDGRTSCSTSPKLAQVEFQCTEIPKTSQEEEEKVEEGEIELYDIPKNSCTVLCSSEYNMSEVGQVADYDVPKKNCTELVSSKHNLNEAGKVVPEADETENIYENT